LEIREILEKYRVVAVVGLSRDPTKDSHRVASFLKSKRFSVIPVNPTISEVLGEKSYPSLLDLPESLKRTVEVVDIFRRPEDVPPIVEQAVELRKRYGHPHVVWMQLGITNEAAAKLARDAGMDVVMDRCIWIEHDRLFKRPLDASP
jgi:predicted CoA-binding protein